MKAYKSSYVATSEQAAKEAKVPGLILAQSFEEAFAVAKANESAEYSLRGLEVTYDGIIAVASSLVKKEEEAAAPAPTPIKRKRSAAKPEGESNV